MNERGIIHITLLSDMCCGVGESNGADVDTMTAVDSCGIPYIPARRIKGVLREICAVCENVNADFKGVTEKIFGGKNSGSIRIDDGYIDNYAEIKPELLKLQADSDYKTKILPATVTSLYTTNRSQTTIENDIAKKNSLRTIKVVNKGITFNSHIVYDGEYKNQLEKCIKLMRHIGMNKNKGFGYVSCELINETETGTEIVCKKLGKNVKYKITLLGDVVLNGGSNKQVNYISGAAVLGVISRLFRNDFCEKWINNHACISNAYPSKNNKRFVPVPFVWKSEKNNDKTAYYDDGHIYDKSGEFVQYTPIGGFYNISDNKFVTTSVNTCYNYHHTRGISADMDREFFGYRAISAGQTFLGTISADDDTISKLNDLLLENCNSVYFGTSKSAQYGKAIIELEPIKQDAPKVGKKSYSVELLSDAILIDSFGNATADINLFKQYFGGEIVRSFSKVNTIGGYNNSWGMPAQQKNAFSAGTVLVFEDANENAATHGFIGEDNYSGYGEYVIYSNETKNLCRETKTDDNNKVDTSSIAFKQIYEKALFEDVKDDYRRDGIAQAGKISRGGLSLSSVMRFYLAIRKTENSKQMKTELESEINKDYKDDLRNYCQKAIDSFGEYYNDEEKDNILFHIYISSFVEQVRRIYKCDNTGDAIAKEDAYDVQ